MKGITESFWKSTTDDFKFLWNIILIVYSYILNQMLYRAEYRALSIFADIVAISITIVFIQFPRNRSKFIHEAIYAKVMYFYFIALCGFWLLVTVVPYMWVIGKTIYQAIIADYKQDTIMFYTEEQLPYVCGTIVALSFYITGRMFYFKIIKEIFIALKKSSHNLFLLPFINFIDTKFRFLIYELMLVSLGIYQKNITAKLEEAFSAFV